MDAPPDGARWTTDRLAPGLVLHIEDNSSNLRLIERLLASRPGVRVMAAMQGRLGLELAREHQPAPILLDLNLPDTQGSMCSAGSPVIRARPESRWWSSRPMSHRDRAGGPTRLGPGRCSPSHWTSPRS
jgi:hypothetical protein